MISGFADIDIRIDYANSDKIKRIRAAAKKYGATVKVEQYTKGAWEGKVIVHTTWDEGADKHMERCRHMRNVIKG